MTEKPKKTSQNKKEDVKLDPIRMGINGIMAEYKLPQQFLDVYKISLIMSKLFEPTRWGENFSNLTYQVQRLLSTFGVKTAEFDEELKNVFLDYMRIIQSAQEQLLKGLKGEPGEGPHQGEPEKK